MLKTGILNPHINSLLSRIRHTNLLVIADRGFPFMPTIECIDIALVDDIPTVLDVFSNLSNNFLIGNVWMAGEFLVMNQNSSRAAAMQSILMGYSLAFEPHAALKLRAKNAIGLIRTGDTTPYSNLIIESA